MATAQVDWLSLSLGDLEMALQEVGCIAQVQRWDKKLESGMKSLPTPPSQPQGFRTGKNVVTTAVDYSPAAYQQSSKGAIPKPQLDFPYDGYHRMQRRRHSPHGMAADWYQPASQYYIKSDLPVPSPRAASPSQPTFPYLWASPKVDPSPTMRKRRAATPPREVPLATDNYTFNLLRAGKAKPYTGPDPACDPLEDALRHSFQTSGGLRRDPWGYPQGLEAYGGNAFTEMEWKELYAPLKAGLSAPRNPLQSAGRHKVLPMHFETRSEGKMTNKLLETTADTGSDENAMDWTTFKALGLDLIRRRHSRKQFTLANGKSFTSMGQVQVNCSFARDPSSHNTSVCFNVFSRLASPVIVGKAFLDATETMTVHQDRLIIKEESNDSVLRVMHFNRPSSRIQCSVDGRTTLANADTGAEMNLVSPSFVSKTGKWRHGLHKENLQIMLADGSLERVTASFEGNLSLVGYHGRSDVTSKFYVLPGLTSEALIGEDTLDEVDVFSKHLDAFVSRTDDEDEDEISLNIIKWLTERESWLINALTRRSAADGTGTTAATSLADIALSPRAFRAALADADARECHRRDQAERRIGTFSGRERLAALYAEQLRAFSYQTERTRCLALHQQRINAHRI